MPNRAKLGVVDIAGVRLESESSPRPWRNGQQCEHCYTLTNKRAVSLQKIRVISKSTHNLVAIDGQIILVTDYTVLPSGKPLSDRYPLQPAVPSVGTQASRRETILITATFLDASNSRFPGKIESRVASYEIDLP